MTSDAIKTQVLNDPASSHWLKYAIETAARRDPVDALNDIEILNQFAQMRHTEVTKGGARG